MALTRNGVSSREEEIKLRGEIDAAPDVAYCRARSADGVRTLPEYLGAQGKVLSQVPLNQPPREPGVSLSGSRIQRQATPTIGRPWSPALLDPEGKRYHVVPFPSPLLLFPVASSAIGNTPI